MSSYIGNAIQRVKISRKSIVASIPASHSTFSSLALTQLLFTPPLHRISELRNDDDGDVGRLEQVIASIALIVIIHVGSSTMPSHRPTYPRPRPNRAQSCRRRVGIFYHVHGRWACHLCSLCLYSIDIGW